MRSIGRTSRLGAAVTTLLATLALTGGAAPAAAAGSCEGLTGLTLPNTVITSASVAPPSGTVPASCRVHATVTHPPAGDIVNIDVWLPVEGWNGRFQGVGGGYAGGAVTQTRPICLYPEVAAYKGRGDVAAASSFACRRSR